MILFIFRIHNYVMSFVFFIASEHIQTVGQVPTDTNYSYSLYQVLVFPQLQLLSKPSIGLTSAIAIAILYTKYWSDTSYNHSLKQVLVRHQLQLFSTPSIGLTPAIVILYTKYWSDTNYSYSPIQVLVYLQLYWSDTSFSYSLSQVLV